MKPELLEALSAHLREYGLSAGSGQGLRGLEPGVLTPVTLKYRGSEKLFQMAYAPQMTMSALTRTNPDDSAASEQFVVGPRITERSAEILRNVGANYLDASGNAHIAFGDVLIDVRGRKAAPIAKHKSGLQSRGGVNLMSPKRAQVIFALLSWEHLLDEPVRSLAVASKVSLGQAQETLELLAQHGYLGRGRGMVQTQRERLLEHWVGAYHSGLGAKQLRLKLAGDISAPLEPRRALLVSGESAAGGALRPETLTLYSDERPTELIRQRRWQREDAQPNVFLKQKFWEAPNSTDTDKVGIAPPLLVYADLLATGDGRQREAASEYRRQHDQLRAG